MTPEDLAAIGKLISYGARPKEMPARSEPYDGLVQRYLNDEAFRAAANTVADGAGLTLHVDSIVGVLAISDTDGPFRIPLAEFRKRTYDSERALLGVVVLAIAQVAYPSPEHLEDAARVPPVSVAGVVDYLNRITERLAAAAAADPEAGDPALVEVWRHWLQMREARFDAVRISLREKVGIVKKSCGYFEQQGLLQKRSDDDGGTYLATNRLRIAVLSLVEDSDLYASLLELTIGSVDEDTPTGDVAPNGDDEPTRNRDEADA